MGETLAKNVKIYKFEKVFTPQKFIPLRYAPFPLAPVE